MYYIFNKWKLLFMLIVLLLTGKMIHGEVKMMWKKPRAG